MVYKIMITGHRPQKLPKDSVHYIKLAMLDRVQALVDEYGTDLVLITGMALGPDQWFAEIGLKFGIPVHAYLPFKGQEKYWSEIAKSHYRNLLDHVANVTVISDTQSRNAYLSRNIAMVEQSDHCIAVWDGGTHSGTGHAVRNARERGVSLDIIDPAQNQPDNKR